MPFAKATTSHVLPHCVIPTTLEHFGIVIERLEYVRRASCIFLALHISTSFRFLVDSLGPFS